MSSVINNVFDLDPFSHRFIKYNSHKNFSFFITCTPSLCCMQYVCSTFFAFQCIDFTSSVRRTSAVAILLLLSNLNFIVTAVACDRCCDDPFMLAFLVLFCYILLGVFAIAVYSLQFSLTLAQYLTFVVPLFVHLLIYLSVCKSHYSLRIARFHLSMITVI